MAEPRTGFLKSVPGMADGLHLHTGTPAPEAIRAVFGEWPAEASDDTDLSALQTLHAKVLDEYQALLQTLVSVRDDDDPSLNDDGRLKIAARIIEPKLDTLAEVASQEFERIDTAIKGEEAKIAAALRQADAIDIAVHADIRAHLRSLALTGSGAIVAVRAAVDEGDLQTLQAVATAPAHMSGLQGGAPTAGVINGASVYAEAQAAARAIKAPDQVKRLQALQAGREMARKAVDELGRKADRFLDFKRARELIEQEAKRKERYGVGA